MRARIASFADVRLASPYRPVMAMALRVLGVALVLLALVLPQAEAKAVVEQPARAKYVEPLEEGGACDETEQEELIECGAYLEGTLDEPLTIALLRALDVRMTEQACSELLADIWAQQSCQAQGRDCGKMNSGAPPGPAPKLASSSSSARSSFGCLGLDPDTARGLALDTAARRPRSHELQPPVPPPRLLAH